MIYKLKTTNLSL